MAVPRARAEGHRGVESTNGAVTDELEADFEPDVADEPDEPDEVE